MDVSNEKMLQIHSFLLGSNNYRVLITNLSTNFTNV